MNPVAHYGKASAWSERQFRRLPVIRRDPARYARAAKLAGLTVVALLIVNEIRVIWFVADHAPEGVTAYKAIYGDMNAAMHEAALVVGHQLGLAAAWIIGLTK